MLSENSRPSRDLNSNYSSKNFLSFARNASSDARERFDSFLRLVGVSIKCSMKRSTLHKQRTMKRMMPVEEEP